MALRRLVARVIHSEAGREAKRDHRDPGQNREIARARLQEFSQHGRPPPWTHERRMPQDLDFASKGEITGAPLLADWVKRRFSLSRSFRPRAVMVALRVDALEPVGAEEIALALDEVGGAAALTEGI